MQNNSEIQALFHETLEKLDKMPKDRKNAERMMAYVWIERMKIYSSSGNEVPGLRGLGLEKAIKLSEEILSNGLVNIKVDWNGNTDEKSAGFNFKLG